MKTHKELKEIYYQILELSSIEGLNIDTCRLKKETNNQTLFLEIYKMQLLKQLKSNIRYGLLKPRYNELKSNNNKNALNLETF